MKKILKSRFITTAHVLFGRGLDELTEAEIYKTIATTAKQSISDNWIKTNRQYTQKCVKQIYYFSVEFLLGRLLRSNLINLGIEEAMKEVLQEFNLKLSGSGRGGRGGGAGAAGPGPASPPASSTRSLHTVTRGMAAPFAISTDSSSRRSSTAIRWSCLTTGCATASYGSTASRTNLSM